MTDEALTVQAMAAILRRGARVRQGVTDVWFPEPGCYEITGRIGRQQSVIVLRIAGPAAK